MGNYGEYVSYGAYIELENERNALRTENKQLREEIKNGCKYWSADGWICSEIIENKQLREDNENFKVNAMRLQGCIDSRDETIKQLRKWFGKIIKDCSDCPECEATMWSRLALKGDSVSALKERLTAGKGE